MGPIPTHPTVPTWTHTLCVGTSYMVLPRKGGTGGEKGWFLALKIVISSFDGFFDYIPVGCDHHGGALCA